MKKLVRDLIPKIIEDEGKTAIYEVVEGAKLESYIKRKILEEAQEVIDAKTQKDIIEEIADLTEVLDKYMKAMGIAHSQVAEIRIRKRMDKGGFNKGFVLDLQSNKK